MLSLIEAGPAALEVVATLAREDVPTVPLTAVRLLAPIPRLRKNVVYVGWNYVEHFAEAHGIHRRGQDLPSHPTFFTKAPTSVIGPYDPIPVDASVSDQIDWEAELAVVIGARGR